MANANVEDAAHLKSVRPISITLISIWLFFSVFTAVWLILKGYVASSIVNTTHFAIGGIVSLVCGVGFWLMKKWAVYLYAVFGLINQVVLLVLGRWNIFSLLVLGIIIYFGYRNLSKMS